MAGEATPEVEPLLNEYVNLLNGNYSNLDILSESYRYHGPGLSDEGIRGRESYRDFLQTFHDAFSNLEYVITDMLASEHVVMAEWRVTGTHDGKFNEIPPTGREIEMQTMGKIHISNGKIQEEWGYYDPNSLVAQLGVE